MSYLTSFNCSQISSCIHMDSTQTFMVGGSVGQHFATQDHPYTEPTGKRYLIQAYLQQDLNGNCQKTVCLPIMRALDSSYINC